MFTQLAKMMVLATFFPDNVEDLGSDIIGVLNTTIITLLIAHDNFRNS